jgi:hypothetical protein
LIEKQVALAGLQFLNQVSSAFETEPYLSASPSGTLVMEFGNSNLGGITFEISPTFAVAYWLEGAKVHAESKLVREWSVQQVETLRG